jgi:hypothetical protein
MEYLPPYAPELNPVEYIWAHCKHHELPNVCAKNLWDLKLECAAVPQAHASAGAVDHCVLEAGFFIRLIPLYYAGFSWKAPISFQNLNNRIHHITRPRAQRELPAGDGGRYVDLRSSAAIATNSEPGNPLLRTARFLPLNALAPGRNVGKHFAARQEFCGDEIQVDLFPAY